MIKRPLGKTGISVSEIAFGGVEIGMPYGIGVRSADDMLSEEQSIELLRSAVRSGINFFDTARQYGKSEDIMGNAFKECRQEVIIASKCRHLGEPGGSLPGEKELKKILNDSFEESLHALQTEYIDLYMLHDSDELVLQNEVVLCFFQGLKKSGKIRATGVSTYTPEQTKKVIDSKNWDVIQVPFNLMDQRQETLFKTAEENGIGIVVRSVLMKGLLSEKGKALHPALSKVESHIQGYDQLLSKDLADLPTVATKFALSFKEVSSILIGMDRMEYLERSVTTADGKYMDRNTLQVARELAYPEPEFLNLHTWNVNGWLK